MAGKLGKKIKDLNLFAAEHLRVKGNQIGPSNAFEYFNESEIHQSLPGRFEAQVKRYPSHTAVKTSEGVLNYRQLNERCNRVARTIWELYEPHKEAGSGGAALLFDHGADMIIGMLAVLKTGRFYVPLDPTAPARRLIHILKDSNVDILLTDDKNIDYAIELSKQLGNKAGIININGLGKEGDRSHIPVEDTGLRIDSSAPAYILYTSGSTGKPKGLVQTHRNALHFIRIYTNHLHICPEDRLTLFSFYGFDASVMDIYGGLLNGAAVYPFDIKKEENISRFWKWLREERISIYHSVPTLFRHFMEILPAEGADPFPDLRLLVMGGEAVYKRDIERYKRYFGKDCLLVNLLGSTESSVNILYFPDRTAELERDAVPVGFHVENTGVSLLDDDNCETGVLRTGEIIYTSDYLALGYINRQEETDNVFAVEPGRGIERRYRSGDLGRRSPNGSIEFVGRKDLQFKIRGNRVEPGEIESILDRIEGIKKCAVICRWDANEENYLAAYIIPEEEKTTSADQLKRILGEYLPQYMIPSVFMEMEEFPLTRSGKIDRKSLPDPVFTGAGLRSDQDNDPPQGTLEQVLAETWSELLEIDKKLIKRGSNFFDLGGHSLRAIVLCTQIHKCFNVNVPLSVVFEGPTLKDLSRYIGEEVPDAYVSIDVVEKKEYYGLSPAQLRQYILQQLDPESTAYNLFGFYVLADEAIEPDLQRLSKSLKKLIERHESLRTSFHLVDDVPVQVIHDEGEFEIDFLATGDTKIERNFVRPFDLSHVPLFRVGLVKIEDNGYGLVLDMHHIITDGTSNQILQDEFAVLYSGGELAGLRLQYKDFAQWQCRWNQGSLMSQQEAYWLQVFRGEIPVLDLPVDFPRPAIKGYEGSTVRFALGPRETQCLKTVAREVDATLYMVLLSVFTVLLSKLSDQEDIVVGTPAAGRRHADLQHIIGFFINTMAVRNYPSGEKRFIEFLKEVKKQTIKAYENQEYPFENLVENLELARDISRNPLFDVMLVMQNMERKEINVPGLKTESYPYRNQTAMFDLTLTAVERVEKVSMAAIYNTALFKHHTINRFIDYLKKILSAVLENPDKKLSEIEILSLEEKRQILYDFNNTSAAYPKDKMIHQLFEEQVVKTPDHVALIGPIPKPKFQIPNKSVPFGRIKSFGENISITYRQLNKRADQLAYLLKEKGVKPDTIVGIMVERSFEMFIGLLGILKAGGAFLPIDPGPNFPRERTDFMLADSGARILLASPETRVKVKAEVEERFIEVIDISNLLSFPPSTSTSTCRASSANLAYVIYTSGSTGKPKGVMIHHQPVHNFIRGITQRIDFTPGKTILALTTISFDIFVLETLLPLSQGLRIVIANEHQQLEINILEELIVKSCVDMLQATPTRMRIFTGSGRPVSCLKELKEIMIGGEPFPGRLLGGVRKLTPARIYNMYGPTETTVWSTMKELTQAAIEEINIGQPILNTQIYILNRNSMLQPVGVIGRLCIGGDGLARGYLNQPELTTEKFTSAINDRLYMTGDLARWLSDGNIEFLGRIDNQVKIRGFRVELGEVENRLLKLDRIEQAVVVCREDKSGDKYICAYFIAGIEYGISELREYLSMELPDYMIPSHFVSMDKLPLTPNGKIDRKTLPLPVLKASDKYEAPRDGIEKKLVEIWSGVLGIEKEKIGINDNFFHLGGHSLKATVLITKIHKELNVTIPLREIFKMPTIRGLSQYIKEAEKENYISIEVAEDKEYYVLSSVQKRFYILQQMEPGATAYNISTLLVLEGRLHRQRLEQTFRELITRHESLRTSFFSIQDEPVQKVHDEVEFEIEFFDSERKAQSAEPKEHGLPAPCALHPENTLQNFVRPFDLSRAQLLRVGLIKEDEATEERHLLLFDMHHIVSDGISMEILIREFVELYNGKTLPVLKIQYKDFSEWQNRRLNSGELEEQEDYWLKQLEGEILLLDLPGNYPRSFVHNFKGKEFHFGLDRERFEALKNIAKAYKLTLFMVLLSIYNIFLAKLSSREDIVVGTQVACRRHPDLEQIIGSFINTLAMRNYPQGEKTIKTFMQEVKERTLQAFENQEYQFEDLVTKLGVKRIGNWNPLFNVLFAIKNISISNPELPELKILTYRFEKKTTTFDLTLICTESVDNLTFVIEYSTSLFKKERIKRLSRYLINIIDEVIKNPGIKISEIDILKKEERDELIKKIREEKGILYNENREEKQEVIETNEAEFAF